MPSAAPTSNGACSFFKRHASAPVFLFLLSALRLCRNAKPRTPTRLSRKERCSSHFGCLVREFSGRFPGADGNPFGSPAARGAGGSQVHSCGINFSQHSSKLHRTQTWIHRDLILPGAWSYFSHINHVTPPHQNSNTQSPTPRAMPCDPLCLGCEDLLASIHLFSAGCPESIR